MHAMAPAVPVEEGWIAPIPHYAQHVELLRWGKFRIQLRTGRLPPAIVAGLPELGRGCVTHLLVPIQPSQANLQHCLAL